MPTLQWRKTTPCNALAPKAAFMDTACPAVTQIVDKCIQEKITVLYKSQSEESFTDHFKKEEDLQSEPKHNNL